MYGWTSLYEQPTVLSMEWGHHRIYAPASYQGIRTTRLVPIVLSEAAALASAFPICWGPSEDGPVLLALRSLLPGGEGVPGDARQTLPQTLQAYPIAVPNSHAIERQQLVVDRTIADQPTDIGAPLILANGKLSRGALFRAKTALGLARARPATEALTRDLKAGGFLEPWPLSFDLGRGETVRIDDLQVLSATRLTERSLFDIVDSHGPEAGLFVAFHRISLFRIGVLVSAARAAVARRASEHGEREPT